MGRASSSSTTSAPKPARAVLRRAAFVVLYGMLLAVLQAQAAAAPTTAREAARRGAGYVTARQEPNGAFFSADQPPDMTALGILALVSGAIRGEPVDRALAYVAEKGPERAAGRAGHAGRIAMGIFAAGADPRNLHGHDYVAAIEDRYDPATGAYDENLFANALALLGLAAGGTRAPEEAIRFVRANQCASGGFGWILGCGSGPDVDTTAQVLQALVAHGFHSSDFTVSRTTSWLAGAVNDEGGFGVGPGDETNANSTGLSLSAIAGLGQDPTAPPWGQPGGPNPVDALAALQDDSGGFRWKASETRPNDFATLEAVPGIAGRAYPIPPSQETARDPAPVRQGLRDGAVEGRVSSTTPPRVTAPPGAASAPDVLADEGRLIGEGSRPGAAARGEKAPAEPRMPIVGIVRTGTVLLASAAALAWRRRRIRRGERSWSRRPRASIQR